MPTRYDIFIIEGQEVTCKNLSNEEMLTMVKTLKTDRVDSTVRANVNGMPSPVYIHYKEIVKIGSNGEMSISTSLWKTSP